MVSRYEEDISWVSEILPNLRRDIYIYNKGSPLALNIPNSKIIELENLGRESHTYLHHVIENYNSLPDITLFLPGSLMSIEEKQNQLKLLLKHIETTHTSGIMGHADTKSLEDVREFYLDNYEISNPVNRAKNSDKKLVPSLYRPYKRWFGHRFPDEKISCISSKGILAASRESIRRRSVEFYKELLVEHSKRNAEVVHYSERSWKNIFSIEPCLPY